jgi:hypothetical protein
MTSKQQDDLKPEYQFRHIFEDAFDYANGCGIEGTDFVELMIDVAAEALRQSVVCMEGTIALEPLQVGDINRRQQLAHIKEQLTKMEQAFLFYTPKVEG